MKKTIITLLFFLPCCATWSRSLPDTYSAGPTWGTVVDATTKEPLKGVLVLALWDLEGGMEWSRFATLKAMEAVTDAQGQFRIEGWGPVPRPSKGILNEYDPQVFFFKPGYVPERLLNKGEMPLSKRAYLEVHDWPRNGKTIALNRYEGSLKDYSARVAFIEGSLYSVFDKGCDWKQLPKAVRALEDEHKRERAAGTTPAFGGTFKMLMSKKECAPTDEFEKKFHENN